MDKIKEVPNQNGPEIALPKLSFFSIANWVRYGILPAIILMLMITSGVLIYLSFVAQQQQLLVAQQQRSRAAAGEINAYLEDLQRKLSYLSRVRGLTDFPLERQHDLLLALVHHNTAYETVAIFDADGQKIAQISPFEHSLPDNISDSLFFLRSFKQKEDYIGQVEFDLSYNSPFVTLAVPIRDNQDKVNGVLLARINLEFLWFVVSDTTVGESGYVYIIDDRNVLVAEKGTTPETFVQKDLATQPFIQYLTSESVDTLTPYQGLKGQEVLGAIASVPSVRWNVIVELPTAEAFAPLRNLLIVMGIALGVALLFIVGLGYFFSRSIVSPLQRLTEAAVQMSNGNLEVHVDVTNRNETGVLAATFNQMVTQLESLYATLEERVADRTQRLEAIATISERVTAILDLNELLSEVVEQVKEQFSYYHVHIYLLDETNQYLVIAEGTGEAGNIMKAEGHRIHVQAETSLVARAERTGEVVWVNNVREAADWLPNKLLPDTYAEMAVPINNEGKALGVLDVQSDKISGLNEGDVSLLRSLANQIGVAVNNARLYAGLAKLNADKDLFFSIVGHDLKGPFQPLLGNAEFLVEMAELLPPAEIKNVSNSILASGKRVLELLENLLQWSQFQMGRMEYQPETLDVAQVAARTVRLLEEVAKSKEIRLENKVAEGIQVYADKQMLATIIRNLTNNALKFTGADDEVSVNALRNDQEIEIQIQDTGVGMSEQHQAELFQVGVNSSTSGTANEQGTGLGLIMCQEMVILNGGRIWVESELGVGTTVSFTIPISGGEPQASKTAMEPPKVTEVSTKAHEKSAAKEKQPLAVIRLSNGMNRSAGQIYKLLEDMIRWTKDELSALDYEPKNAELSLIVSEVLAELHHQSQQQAVQLVNEVPAEVQVHTDITLLTLVLQGLILNGLKFSPSGSQLIVSTNLEEDRQVYPGYVEVSVSDEGEGWQERETSRLFNQYIYHLLSGEQQRTQVGLGLMIYDALVRKNGGQLWVESEVGQGTTVRFTVPIMKDE